MSKITEWHKARKEAHDARNYVGIIGKTTTRSTVASREGEHATAGTLHKLVVSTQMHFQPYDGAQNYHDCKAFDAALSHVVRSNWTELHRQALDHLAEVERITASAARTEVEAQLAEIEAADAAQAMAAAE